VIAELEQSIRSSTKEGLQMPGEKQPKLAEQIEKLVTVTEVKERFTLPKSWVYAKAASGELPSYKCGKHIRFKLSELERWLEAQRRQPEGTE
jgi:excisionase family DNA binding protein